MTRPMRNRAIICGKKGEVEGEMDGWMEGEEEERGEGRKGEWVFTNKATRPGERPKHNLFSWQWNYIFNSIMKLCCIDSCLQYRRYWAVLASIWLLQIHTLEEPSLIFDLPNLMTCANGIPGIGMCTPIWPKNRTARQNDVNMRMRRRVRKRWLNVECQRFSNVQTRPPF